jgi:GntR family transcriptional repressor for pyruvate dehydrogenase complex
MPLQTVENRRLYRQIADQISTLITSGEFGPGRRLPSERDLARQLGVSRPSVREALISLEIEGKVEVRVGAGIFVAAQKAPTLDGGADEGQGPFELLRARWLVEGEVAAVAARERTDGDLAPIRAAVEDMQRLQRLNQSAESADRAFHMGIVTATHNSALVSVVQYLWDRGRGAMWKRMEHHFLTAALRAATLRDHRAVYEAIAARSARDARAAMHRHLERVDREFTRGWELLKGREGESVPPLPVRADLPPLKPAKRVRKRDPGAAPAP